MGEGVGGLGGMAGIMGQNGGRHAGSMAGSMVGASTGMRSQLHTNMWGLAFVSGTQRQPTKGMQSDRSVRSRSAPHLQGRACPAWLSGCWCRSPAGHQHMCSACTSLALCRGG